MDMEAWASFLDEWASRASRWLSREPPSSEPLRREFLAKGSFRSPGATEAALKGCEKRLGSKLPPSYRAFLAASNGGLIVTANGCVRLSTCTEIDWFAERDPSGCAAWSPDAFGGGLNEAISDKKYFQYGKSQDPVLIRREYVPETLLISDLDNVDLYLLNPMVVTDDENEDWEAWELSSKLAGAIRRRSFEELMQLQARSLEQRRLVRGEKKVRRARTKRPGISRRR
jgi:SMI1/KNR4 family protein SUKH-1